MGGVFISYRWNDAQGIAGRLHDCVARELPTTKVYFDGKVRSGDSLGRWMKMNARRSKVLIAVIGPGWLDARDEKGKRRIDRSSDPVRKEIVTALRWARIGRFFGWRKTVLPLLIDDAAMPRPEQLPVGLQLLGDCKALRLRQDLFDHDAQALIAQLKRDGAEPVLAPIVRFVSVGTTALVLVLAALYVGQHYFGETNTAVSASPPVSHSTPSPSVWQKKWWSDRYAVLKRQVGFGPANDKDTSKR